MDYSSINYINVNWKKNYRRNNKSKYVKHLLCFPDHKNGIHIVLSIYLLQNNKFCGQSIKVFIKCPSNVKKFVFGRFEIENKNTFNIDDIISGNYFEFDKNLKSPFYSGYETIQNNIFEINRELKSWNYPIINIHGEKFVFTTYLCIKDEKNCKCVAKCSSPSFSICSSRRNPLSIEEGDINYITKDVDKDEDITNTDLDKFNNILRSLSDDTIPIKLEKEKTTITKNFNICDIENLFEDIITSKPYTEYIDEKHQFSFKKINQIPISSEREELTPFGTTTSIPHPKGLTYLDRYGNIITITKEKVDEYLKNMNK